MKLKSRTMADEDEKLVENDDVHFHDFLNNLSRIIEFDAGSLFLYDTESEALKEVANKGEGIDFISSVHFPLGNGLSAWVAQKGKLIYLPDIHRGSRHGENPVRSYVSIPLEVNSKVLGVLNLGHGIPHAFSDEDIKRIECVGKEAIRRIVNRKYLKLN
ncbi:MAG: GAF domain-containing protein [bacterium]